MDNSLIKNMVRSAIEVSKITTGQYQKAGTETAELRQTVTTTSIYKGSQHDNDMQDNLFTSEEFGDEQKEFTNQEIRVAFIDVPEGISIEQVQARIPKDAVLYRILSHAPILHSNHKNAINSGITSKDDIAISQVVRYSQNHAKANQIIVNDEKIMYRKIFFSTTPKDDMDLRNDPNHPPYVPSEITMEIGVTTPTNEVVIESQDVVS